MHKVGSFQMLLAERRAVLEVLWSSGPFCSGPELFALLAKVAKFIVCRNDFLRFLVIS